MKIGICTPQDVSEMKAWLLDRFDGLSALRLDPDVDAPQPAAGEVLIRVHCASLNPADRYLAQGQYPARPALPHILGRDGCGEVTDVGKDVTGIRKGDRVVILRGAAGVDRWGTFADLVAVPQEVVVPIPDGWDEPQAAAAPLVYVTAHQALTQWGPRESATVLITGVSGGVGIAALQLARSWGWRVIGLTRSEAKRAALSEMGADRLLDPDDDGMVSQVKEFTGGRGVDLIVENIGGPLFARVLDTLGHAGRISVVGMLAGPVPQFNTAKLLFKRLRIGGVSVSDYTVEAAREAWGEIVRGLDRIGQRPRIDTVFPFDKLPDAFDRLANGPLGKVLLQVAPSA